LGSGGGLVNDPKQLVKHALKGVTAKQLAVAIEQGLLGTHAEGIVGIRGFAGTVNLAAHDGYANGCVQVRESKSGLMDDFK
jgi:hypothetical protein